MKNSEYNAKAVNTRGVMTQLMIKIATVSLLLFLSGCSYSISIPPTSINEGDQVSAPITKLERFNASYSDDFIKLNNFKLVETTKEISISFTVTRSNMNFQPILSPNTMVILTTENGSFRVPLKNIFYSKEPLQHTIYFPGASGAVTQFQIDGLQFKDKNNKTLPGISNEDRITVLFTKTCHCMSKTTK